MKPSQAAVAASAALQSFMGTGPSGAQRKALGQVSHSGNALGLRRTGGVLKDKENLRALGMGIEVEKVTGKLQVLADDGMEGVPVKPLENRLRVRRALGDKSRSDVQPLSSNPSTRYGKAPSATSAFTVFADPAPHESIGQENIPPLGADPENNPSPALRRSTRKTMSISLAHTRPTSSAAQHDSGIEDPESPYISKPRLRKLKPTPMERAHTVEIPQNGTIASSSQLQPTSLVLASSQPQSDVPETLDSSPLIARPQTRKSSSSAVTASSSKHRPIRHPISAYSVQPDPVLCDVSEAYGADTSAQPADFRRGLGSARGASRKVVVQRDGEGEGEGRRVGLRSSVCRFNFCPVEGITSNRGFSCPLRY